MITSAPLPEWKDLVQSFYKRELSQIDLAKPWINEGDISGWLSRSAWSLALIYEWRKKYYNISNCNLWIPDYFCNASLTPLRISGATLIFYPINEEMLPDISRCKELALTFPPDIFILVHYFGKPANSKLIKEFCIINQTWLIEDAAHVLKPIKGIGNLGDFILYSPHKHLPVPDGALLIASKSGISLLGDNLISITGKPETWSSQLQPLKAIGKKIIIGGEKESLIWLFKRILQKFNVRPFIKVVTQFSELGVNEDSLSKIIGPKQSAISKKILSIQIKYLNIIERKRRRNQLLLDELLNIDFPLIKSDRSDGKEWTPYLASYNIEYQDPQHLYKFFTRKLGLPISTWPDLAPEVIKGKSIYNIAWELRHKRIFFPIHQAISFNQLISEVKNDKIETINDVKITITIKWGNISSELWQQYFIRSGKTNLLQSWEYGNTKSAMEGWTIKRGVIYNDKEPIAIIQLLQKKYFKTITVNRINRGPLPLRILTAQEVKSIFKELGKIGNLFKTNILFVAPEIKLSGQNILLLEQNKYKQFSYYPWESIWIDLSKELDILRKNIDGKWRNMLNFSEKSDLKLTYGSDDTIFYWLMNEYKELMNEKKFRGMSVDFLSHFRNSNNGSTKMIVYQATKDEVPVAGICVVCHGVAATYLIGWNGSMGRTLKANQFLLWNAIVHLKKLGFEHFDLGGINEQDVPGITAFKMGLNGNHYELIGEYLKW